jgi:hypothetical protein
MHRATLKLRNLEGLEQRELEEQDRLMEGVASTDLHISPLAIWHGQTDLLRGLVAKLAHLRQHSSCRDAP